MSIEIQELAVRYGAAWAEHDLDAIMAMHTEDTVFHLHGGGGARRRARRDARGVCRRSLPVARHPIREDQGPHRRGALRQRISDERNLGRKANHL